MTEIFTNGIAEEAKEEKFFFFLFSSRVVCSIQLCRQPFCIRSTHADIPEVCHRHLLPMRQ